MAELSKTDKQNLSPAQQTKVLEYKDQWQKAYERGDTKGMEDAHAAAEKIRKNAENSAGYSGGAGGNSYKPLAVNNGGRTAEQMASDLAAYRAANTNYGSDKYDGPHVGWTNGYSVAMNVRSMANEVRQQMQANSEAWHTADEETRKYLHEENLKLAEILRKNTGQGEETTYYNEDLGRWETWNPNVGYGYYMGGTQANIRNAMKEYYGYTDEEIENWAKDTSHYYNFVDVMGPSRKTTDESSGYTGQYAQFFNGPYIPGSHYITMEDVYGDGFGKEAPTFMDIPQYDENGNIIKTAPALKGNNNASAYTQQFLPVAKNGVLTGRGEKVDALDTTVHDNNAAGQRAYFEATGGFANTPIGKQYYGTSGGSAGGFEGYLQQLYASALEAQLKALESGYTANLSELDASQKSIDGAYAEQKRQTSGQAAQNSAAWREMANAYGLNSGAVGQASLAQRNQLQSDLNKLNAAQASARTELQRQRLLLGQQYQLAIQQAVAENNSELAKSLYEEAVRAEESLQQQEQFYANLSLQYGKSMMSFAKNSASGLSREQEFSLIEEAVRNGFITDTQGLYLAQLFGFDT